MPLVVVGLAAFLLLVEIRGSLVASNRSAGVKEGLPMAENYTIVPNVLETIWAVGTGYLAGSLPA